MRSITWCGFAIVLLALVSCGVTDAAFAYRFHADLAPSAPSAANGVTSALIYRKQLVVSGTFSGLSGQAQRVAIMDGNVEVVDLRIVHQDATHSGAFERVFAVAGHESALKERRYEVRVMTNQSAAGELKGTLVPLGPSPHSLDLGAPTRWEEPPLAR